MWIGAFCKSTMQSFSSRVSLNSEEFFPFAAKFVLQGSFPCLSGQNGFWASAVDCIVTSCISVGVKSAQRNTGRLHAVFLFFFFIWQQDAAQFLTPKLHQTAKWALEMKCSSHISLICVKIERSTFDCTPSGNKPGTWSSILWLKVPLIYWGLCSGQELRAGPTLFNFPPSKPF